MVKKRHDPIQGAPKRVTMEIYVGTSGWAYPWNEGADLLWYREHSGLSAVELNASFYRFLYPNQIQGMRIRGKGLRFSVKIHRWISHRYQLKEPALPHWERFFTLFRPLDDLVDFYLLQLPPRFQDLQAVARFAGIVKLGSRLAVEFRHPDLLRRESFPELNSSGAVVVSTDSPLRPRAIVPGEILYLRLHGRRAWYSDRYTERELKELAKALVALHPRKIYAFFNNDTAMLANARRFLAILRELSS
jgi:uncharacterized protein YecE (DUF72 family)